MKKIEYKTQTCNGNPEVIRLENGIAREVVAGDKSPINILQAEAIARNLNERVKSGEISLTDEA